MDKDTSTGIEVASPIPKVKKPVTVKEKDIASSSQILEKPTQEPPVIHSNVEPVEEEAYDAFYYEPQKASYGAAGLWFAIFYCVLAIPVFYVYEYFITIVRSLSQGLSTLDLSTEIFIGSGVFGAIAVILAIVGLCTFKRRNQSIIPPILAILLVAANAVASYLVFVA